jgi:hypothetical protein
MKEIHARGFPAVKDVASRAAHLRIIHFGPHKLHCSKHSRPKMRQLFYPLFAWIRSNRLARARTRPFKYRVTCDAHYISLGNPVFNLQQQREGTSESACRSEMQRVNRITTTAADKFQAARALSSLNTAAFTFPPTPPAYKGKVRARLAAAPCRPTDDTGYGSCEREQRKKREIVWRQQKIVRTPKS